MTAPTSMNALESEPSLSEVLAHLGFTRSPIGHGRYVINRPDGSLFREGRAWQIWDALREAGLYPLKEVRP